MPLVALFLVCAIWGSTFFSQQIGVKAVGDNPLSAVMFLALRFTTATVVMAIIFPQVFRRLNRQTVRDGVIG